MTEKNKNDSGSKSAESSFSININPSDKKTNIISPDASSDTVVTANKNALVKERKTDATPPKSSHADIEEPKSEIPKLKQKPDTESAKMVSVKQPSLLLNFIILFIGLGLAVFLLLQGMSSKGHIYYVESSIQYPVEDEYVSTVSSYGACITDFTKKASKEDLIDTLYAEFSITSDKTSLVQNIITSGCDNEANIPKLEISEQKKIKESES